MTLTAERADELAAALYEARRTRLPIPPLTETDDGLTMADGYLVQQGVVRRYLEDGDRVVGYKLGLTSKPMFVDHAIHALVPGHAPQVMPTRHGDLIWPVASPFIVRMVSEGEERIPRGAYRIVLLVEGSARVVSEFGEITLRPGTAAVISADDPDSFVQAEGLVAIVQSTEVQVEPRRGIDPDEH